MNRIINEPFLKRLNFLLFPVVVLWSFSTLGGVFLTASPMERSAYSFEPFFEIFHLGQKFALSSDVNTSRGGKTVVKTSLVPYPHRIKAIYRADSGSFVVIHDGQKSTIVPLGGKYKENFRLIGLNNTAAIFKGYGTTYRLRMGHEDSLTQRVMTTETVAGGDASGALEDKWITIARKTVVQQLNNLQTLSTTIDVSEVRSGSQINGFRINSIAKDSLFAQLGLLQGDIIKEVNNKKLRSYTDAMALYAQLSHLKSLRITLERNNLQKDIVYEITR